jgi:hypothetical protein
MAFDQLHRIKMHAALAADAVDADDVRVFQNRSGLGFVLEALQLPLVQHRCKRQHLQGDLSAQRNLLRLVHYAHPAPADFAEDAEVAQRAQAASFGIQRFRVGRFGGADGRPQIDQCLHGRVPSSQLVGIIWVLRGKRRDVDRMAGLQAVGEFIDQLGKPLVGVWQSAVASRKGFHG